MQVVHIYNRKYSELHSSGLQFTGIISRRTRGILLVLFFVSGLFSISLAQGSELDSLLVLDLEDLSNLQITSATKELEKINEVPSTVRVITSEMIELNGYATLEDALADLPGFQFRNIQGFNSYIFQRGVPNQNNYTILLVDDIPINELNSGGFYAGGQFNLDNVKQIEVVYGPASALYGTNAISGVVNIVTKDPEDEGLKIRGKLGTFDTYSGSADYSYYNGNAGFRIAGMASHTEKADLAGAEGDYNWSSDMENFETDYSLNLKGVYKNFKAGVLYQNKRASRTTNYSAIGTDYLDKNTLWNIGFLNAYIKHFYSNRDNLNMQTIVSYRNTTVYDNTVAYATDSLQAGYYRPNHLFSGEVVVSYKPVSYFSFIGGILIERESLAESFSVTYSSSANEKPPKPSQPEMENNNLVSTYFQGKLKIAECINLFAGGRYDNSSSYDNVFTPKVGLVYSKKQLTMKLLYSEAYRAPKPWDYTFGAGNSSLDPEKMKSLELAAGYSYTKNSLLTISLYRNRLNDLFELDNEQTRWVNKDKATVEGFEGGAQYNNSFVKVNANYTYTYSVDGDDVQLPEISKHTGNANLIFYPNSIYPVSVRCNYIGKRESPKLIETTNSYTVDAAFVVDMSASYKGVNHFVITVSIKNIFDEKYYHTSNRPPDRYRQPQRSAFLKVLYSL